MIPVTTGARRYASATVVWPRPEQNAHSMVPICATDVTLDTFFARLIDSVWSVALEPFKQLTTLKAKHVMHARQEPLQRSGAAHSAWLIRNVCLENTSHAMGMPPMISGVKAVQMEKLRKLMIHRHAICALLDTARRQMEIANNVPNLSTTTWFRMLLVPPRTVPRVKDSLGTTVLMPVAVHVQVGISATATPPDSAKYTPSVR